MADKNHRDFLGTVILIVSVAMVVYHLVSTQRLLVSPVLHQNIHYMFALAIVFFTAIKSSSKKYYPLWITMLILSLIATGYVDVFFNALTNRQGSPTDSDMVIGVLLVALALAATWRSYGPILPVLAICFAAYTLVAQYLPGVLGGYSPSVPRFISMLSIGLTGMYGTLLGTSANYIFLFLVFGAIMEVSGVNKWFNEIGRLAGRVTRGGPAQTAVISSALVGMMSGSAAANVGITGIFTIPLMKASGYPPEKAGAVEAAASSGGQITPPVMGAAAFALADVLGISYLKVLVMAIVPAIFYYFSIFVDVELTARRLRLQVDRSIPFDAREFVLRLPLFAVPIGVLIYLLMGGYSAAYAAFWAILSLLAVSFVRRETRPSFGQLLNSCVSGAKSGSEIAVVCAALSPIWVTMTVTGLGIKLPAAIAALSGGYLLPAIFLVMIVSVILGMGVPTLAAYLLVAVTVTPALVNMGVLPEAAHMAALYFAVFSAMTPPFAIAALVASRIAGSNYLRTGVESFFLGIFKVILPFFFVYNPVILLIGFTPMAGLLTLVAVTLCILLATAGKARYLVGRLNWSETVACFLVAAIYAAFIVGQNPVVLLASVLGTGMLVAWQWARRRKEAGFGAMAE